MNVALLFGGRGKGAKQPASYRPAFLALEDRESPSGLFGGLSAANLLDGTATALDPLGLARAQAERSSLAALHRDTGTADAAPADSGDIQSDVDVATRRWSSITLGTNGTWHGPHLRSDDLPAPTDVVAQQPHGTGTREVDLSWHYQGMAATSFDVFRSCDGGLHYTKIDHVDYPTIQSHDIVGQNQTACTYGVRAENSAAVSSITYSNTVTFS